MPPPQVRELLTQLRAPIFNILPTLTNERTGMKYLRRRLIGRPTVNYFQALPRLKPLNYDVPGNPYNGWDGSGAAHQAEVVAPGFVEAERRGRPALTFTGENDQRAGWIEDADEYVRFKDLFKYKRKGKGPPKKGERCLETVADVQVRARRPSSRARGRSRSRV